MKTVGEFLKDKRDAKGMSLREAAEKASLSHVQLMDIEKGKKSTTFEKIMSILRVYLVDIDEFLRETGYLPQNVEPASVGGLKKIPVVSWVIAGKWEEVYNTVQPGDAEDWIESDVNGQDVFALRVKGDSMEPEFQDGDIIIVNPHIKPDHNDYVVVKNEEEEATFKQLKKYGVTRVLHPLNPDYPDIVLSDNIQYKIVGKVAEKIKRKRY